MLNRFFFRTNTNNSQDCHLSEIKVTPHLLTAEQAIAEKLLSDLNQEIKAHRARERRKYLYPAALVFLGITGIAISALSWHRDQLYLNKQDNPDTWDEPCGDIIAAWNVQQGHGPYSPTVTCGGFINEDAPTDGIEEQCIELCKHIAKVAVGNRFLEVIFGFIPSFSFFCCAFSCFDTQSEEFTLSSDLNNRFQEFSEEQGYDIDLSNGEALKAFCEDILSRPGENTNKFTIQ